VVGQELSGKMKVLQHLLLSIRQGTNEKVVLVSNFTSACK